MKYAANAPDRERPSDFQAVGSVQLYNMERKTGQSDSMTPWGKDIQKVAVEPEKAMPLEGFSLTHASHFFNIKTRLSR